jgi:hypothetical protein
MEVKTTPKRTMYMVEKWASKAISFTEHVTWIEEA